MRCWGEVISEASVSWNCSIIRIDMKCCSYSSSFSPAPHLPSLHSLQTKVYSVLRERWFECVRKWLLIYLLSHPHLNRVGHLSDQNQQEHAVMPCGVIPNQRKVQEAAGVVEKEAGGWGERGLEQDRGATSVIAHSHLTK